MKYIKRFFKFIFKSLLFSVVFIFSLIFIVSMVIGGLEDELAGTEEVKIAPNSILVLDMSQHYADKPSGKGDINFLVNNFSQLTKKEVTFFELLKTIKKATEDEKIKGIYLKFSYLKMSYPEIHEILASLEKFKETGKFILAHSSSINQRSLLLSSIADKKFVDDVAFSKVTGISMRKLFFTNALGKIGISFIPFKVGKYKSAIETFTRTSMSREDKTQGKVILEQYWNSIENMVSEKFIGENNFDSLVTNLSLMTSASLIEHGYADHFMNHVSLKKLLTKGEQSAGTSLDIELKNYYNEINPKGKDFSLVSITDYISSPSISNYSNEEKSMVGVIVLSGEIVDNSDNDHSITPKETAKKIKTAYEDDNIKAVVIRVNSPGGSITASELVLQEIKKLSEKKPTIISMGTLAASGGYYISVGANKIVSNPLTLTGSIGIFGLLPNVTGLMKKTGITEDRLSSHTYSDVSSPFRSITSFEAKAIQKVLQSGYDIFLQRVADGRNLEKKYVDSVASGRVWTGKDAHQLGLTDEIGGYDVALELAASEANLKDYYIQEIFDEQSIFEQLMGSNNSDDLSTSLLKLINEYPLMKEISDVSEFLKHQKKEVSIYYRTPYNIEIE